MNEEGWRRLCAAVVNQAALDYRMSLKHPKAKDAAYYKADCERFFRNNLGLYSDLDGEWLIRKFEEARKNGKL